MKEAEVRSMIDEGKVRYQGRELGEKNASPGYSDKQNQYPMKMYALIVERQ